MLFRPLMVLAAAASMAQGLRVAVIGGGIGGTATAFYLKKLMQPPPEVHIFEAGEVGGRLATAMVSGFEYEMGGSIIHPRNRLARHLVKLMGLEERAPPPEAPTALYDGKEVVFEESGWGWWDLARMTLRYGPLTLYNVHNQLQKMLADFERIYNAQEKGRHFVQVSELLSHMSPSFLNMTSSSAASIEGVSPTFITEAVGAALRVNYGQWPQAATQFVAFVSLAAAEGGLWSVQGGNRRLPEALLDASGATLRRQRVSAVDTASGGGFRLRWNDTEEPFDAVVLAAPLDGAIALPVPVEKEKRPMEGIWVTLVESKGPRASYFGGRTLHDVISVGASWFNCIARVHPVNGTAPSTTSPVYKIFSSEKPSPEQLEGVLNGVGVVHQRHFLAYPHYEWSKGAEGRLQLLPGLVHTNALEWSASAIEISAIAAKNAALTLVAHFNQTNNDFLVQQQSKEEL